MIASTVVESESHRRPYETVATPDQVPLYDVVPVKGPEGEALDAYRCVRRRDTSEIVSVVSSRLRPERARMFERIAARALLVPGCEGTTA